MLLLLHPWILNMQYFRFLSVFLHEYFPNHFRKLVYGIFLIELIKNPVFPVLRRFLYGYGQAFDAVIQGEETARLASLPVWRHGHSDCGLCREAVESSAEHLIYIKTRIESCFFCFCRPGSVYNTLHNIRDPGSPQPVCKHKIIRIMHLRPVIP